MLSALLVLFAACGGPGEERDASTRDADSSDVLQSDTFQSDTFQRKVLVADLLDDGSPVEGSRSVEMPSPSVAGRLALDVAGCAAPIGETTDRPATFRVAIDGETRLGREVVPEHPAACFEELVEIADEPTAGASLRVDWGVVDAPDQDAPDEDALRLAWSRLSLVRLTPTMREPASSGPNLLLVVVDTLRADHCSLYGYDRPTTPFLESFAREALVFDRALSPSAWTLPATASVFTGLPPHRHGVVGTQKMGQRHHTLAEEMQALGLTTAGFSANPIVDARFGFDQGFETFEHLPWRPASSLVDAFGRWLEAASGQRFFAYLHFFDPHSPYRVPDGAERPFTDPTYDGPYRDMQRWDAVHRAVNWGLDGGPPPPTAEDLEFLVAAYDEEVRYWDRQMARLVANLESRGLLEDTLVVVTSDHGEEFAEHGMYQHGHQLFDESIRVPLLLRGPRWIEAGRRSEPVTIRRLHPTLLHLARGEKPTGEDLRLPDAGATAVSYVTIGGTPNAVVRDVERWAVHRDRWTYLLESRSSEGAAEGSAADRRASGRLFDMRRDPGQTRDLSSAEPGTALSLHRWLEDAALASPGRDAGETDPRLLEELRELGYVD